MRRSPYFRQLALPTVLNAGGGAAAASFAFKGALQYEGTGNVAAAQNMDFSSLSPEAGDLCVIVVGQAGGDTSPWQPLTPAGWSDATTLGGSSPVVNGVTNSYNTIWKILDADETTGPATWDLISADWNVFIGVWSGAEIKTGWHHNILSDTTELVGSNQNQRVFVLPSIPDTDHFVYIAQGSSGAAEWTGPPSSNSGVTPLASGFNGREVTFGHAHAWYVEEGTGSAKTITVTGLGVNFSFNTNSAYYGTFIQVGPPA